MMVRRSLACLLFLAGCGEDKPPAPAAAPPKSASAAASVVATGLPVKLDLPKTDPWPQVVFPAMKVTFKRAPCLLPEEPTFQSSSGPPWNREVWSMTVKTKGGVEINFSELGKDVAARREEWKKEQLEGLVPGEVLFQEPDAVVKRSRVMGKKTEADLPELSKDAVDLAACKKLEETWYCVDVSGDVQLAMAKPTITDEEAMQLLAMLHSLERPSAKGSAPPKSSSGR